ncbi:hypothetical protein RSAG8_06140, partial [Rhizoctonia solani AG-8 WAC10335]
MTDTCSRTFLRVPPRFPQRSARL